MDFQDLEALAKATAQPIKALMQRVAALEAQAGIATHEKDVADYYRGTWKWADIHTRGTLITDKGSLWLCLKGTDTRPGESDDWRLVSKQGGKPRVRV